MKYVILIGDGMADYPQKELGGKTPLEAACTINMDHLAKEGTAGLVKTIPEGFHPGSDVATLTILGYNPRLYYTGRSPLEAASIGVRLGSEDVAFRCNLVTLSRQDGRLIMDDFSAGHISTDEARVLIGEVERNLGGDPIHFYPGVSYRHLMVWKGGPTSLKTVPPHDIMGKDISPYLPRGEGAERLRDLMDSSMDLLRDHPVNRERRARGLKEANSLWFWGEGKAPKLPTLRDRFSLKGAVISAVDLVKGIGIYAGLDVIDVPGVTGYIDTNYKGKAEYALRSLKDRDFVIVHVEAPDEASHNGDLAAKIRAIEDFDREVVGRVLQGLKGDFRLMVLTDHWTPLSLRTHVGEPVPFVIYPPVNRSPYPYFTERMEGAPLIAEGHTLINLFISGKGNG